LAAVAFGDGQGEFAFGVVAVANVGDLPVVDDGDRVEVDRAQLIAVVVGVGGELVKVMAQAPRATFGLGGGGDGVAQRLMGEPSGWWISGSVGSVEAMTA
jgi:hypothetical protein